MDCTYFNPVNLGIDSWAFASSTCSSETLASSTAPAVVGGFTYGEVIQGFFSLLSLIALSVIFFHLHFGRIKIKN